MPGQHDVTTPTWKISASELTRGGLLLTVAGAKTRSIGNTKDVAPGEVVFFQHGTDAKLRVPVVIESVLDAKPFRDLTDKEVTEAGFTSKEGLLHRLAVSQLAKDKHTGNHVSSAEDLAVAKFQIERHGEFGQYTYRLATPEELKGAGLDAHAVQKEVKASVESIRFHDVKAKTTGVDRDLSVERAENMLTKYKLDKQIAEGLKALTPKELQA